MSFHPILAQARIVGPCVSLGAALILCGCGIGTTPQQALARADRNLAAHNYRAATVDLKNLVARQPDDRALHLKLAQALLHMGAYIEAEANFRKAQQLGTPWTALVTDFAEALLGEGQPQQALDLLAAHPPGSAAEAKRLSIRGRALLALQALDTARPPLTQAIALDPADVPARVALAALLDLQSDRAGAKSVLDAAAAVAPGDFAVHLALGAWYARGGEVRQAHAEYQRALDLALAGIRAGSEPWFDEYRSLAGLAETDLALDDVASASQRLTRLRKLAPHATATLLLQARVALRQKRTEDARTALQDLLSRDPQNEPAKVLLGAADAASGELGQAEMYLTAALAANPGDLSARKLLAQVQLGEHKPRDALKTATMPEAAMDADLLALAGQASALTGDLAGATHFLERSEQAAPRDTVRALRLAAAYLADHRAGDALKLLQGLDVPASLVNRREALLLTALSMTGGPETVRVEAQRFAAGHSQDTVALLLAARALVSAKDLKGARALVDAASKLSPDDPNAELLLGAVALAERNAPDAVQTFERLCARYPKSAILRAELARAYMLARRPADARNASAAAVRLDPGYWPALVLETSLALDTGDRASLPPLLEKLRASKAPAPVVQAVDGDVAASSGNLPEALRDYASADAAAPSAELALKIAAARHAMHAADPDASLRSWLQRMPDDARVRLSLAMYLQEEGDRSAAQKQYEAVLHDSPHDVVALNNLAWLRLEAGDKEQALSLARQAYAAASSQPAVEDTFGWALLQTGNAADALPLLRAAWTAAPHAADIHLHFAIALLKTGETSAARRELQSIVNAQPQSPQGEQARSLLAGVMNTAQR